MTASASRSLAAFAAKTTSQFGTRAPESLPPRLIVPTGSVTLDWALRRGGWQLGRLYEIIGRKDAGKSTLMLTGAGIFQRLYPDRGVAYVDMEGTFDPDWAADLGVDCSEKDRKRGRWLHYYPDNAEQASDMAREACRSGVVSVVIVDSVGGMASKKALEKEAEKDDVGSNAKVITRMCQHLATLARQNSCACLLVNQYRANIGSMFGGDISAGPKALEHATTAKIEMAQIGGKDGARSLKFGDTEESREDVSFLSRARVTRLKTGARSRVAEFWINTQPTSSYGPVGIDSADEYLSLGVRLGVIQRTDSSGGYLLPGGTKIRGREKALAHLRAHPDAFDGIRQAVLGQEVSEAPVTNETVNEGDTDGS